jgi:hypothetical protein
MSNLDKLGKQLALTPKQIQGMKDGYAADHQVKGTRPSSTFVKLSEMNKTYASMLGDIQTSMDKFNALVSKDKVRFAKKLTAKKLQAGEKATIGCPHLSTKFEIVA